MTILTVQCKKCKNKMKYQPNISPGQSLKDKKKRCVYCGYTFTIHSNPNDSRIV